MGRSQSCRTIVRKRRVIEETRSYQIDRYRVAETVSYQPQRIWTYAKKGKQRLLQRAHQLALLPYNSVRNRAYHRAGTQSRLGEPTKGRHNFRKGLGTRGKVAGVTGLEPATSGVTGRRSNQLSYTPVYSKMKVSSF